MNYEPYYFVGVVGSRDFKNKNIVLEVMRDLKETQEIGVVSGGARGVDTWAEDFCKDNDMFINVLRPIDPSVKINYLYRDVEIVAISNEIIAFWDEKSKGTKFVIDYAKARGKKLTVYDENGNIIKLHE